MNKSNLSSNKISANAQREFDNAESTIRSFGVNIDLYNGSDLPDEIFPNNWITVNNN